MAVLSLQHALAFFATIVSVYGQCPNEVAQYNDNLRTGTGNYTWMIIPVSTKTAQDVVNSVYPSGSVLLADVPTSDTSLFPSGFDKNAHPIMVYAGFQADIRMGSFQLMATTRPKSAPGTILSAPITNYLSGLNGNFIAGLVPSLVSTLVEGYNSKLGKFIPTDAAYQVNSGNVLSNNVAWSVVPNPISGPGAYLEAYDLQYVRKSSFKKYTPKLFKAMINQPQILAGTYLLANICQRNQYYYNNATSTMTPVAGNATFGSAADGLTVQMSGVLQKAASGGFYGANEGFTACGQNVGFNPEDCDKAAKNVDKAAL